MFPTHTGKIAGFLFRKILEFSENRCTKPCLLNLVVFLVDLSGGDCFLPAAKRQSQAKLWVEKKEKRVMDFWSLKLLFIVSFGMLLSYFELLMKSSTYFFNFLSNF